MSGFKKVYISSPDYDKIASLFSSEENNLIDPADVYSVVVNDKEYFHIRDLEDGDFIGIDKKKSVYRITHDPLEATLIEKKLEEILKEG